MLVSVRLPLLSLLAGGLLANSCQSQDAAVPVPAPTSPAPAPPALPCPRALPVALLPGLVYTAPMLAQVGQVRNLVINDEATYRALFPHPTYTPPPVDFTTHTLLLGKIRILYTGEVARQQLSLTCAGSYQYAVQVQPGLGQAATDVQYHAVVAKLPADAQVSFDVQVLPPF